MTEELCECQSHGWESEAERSKEELRGNSHGARPGCSSEYGYEESGKSYGREPRCNRPECRALACAGKFLDKVLDGNSRGWKPGVEKVGTQKENS